MSRGGAFAERARRRSAGTGRRPRFAGTGSLRAAVDLLIPPACVLCHRGLDPGRPPLCLLCEGRLPRLPPPRCARCGAPAAGGTAACPECEGWPEDGPPCAAPYAMREGAAKLVRSLKYDGWEALAGPMGRAMVPAARRLKAGSDAPPALVPVPLSPARLRERGFNQAELLAVSLGAAGGFRVARLLERRRAGRRQARLGRRGRAANVWELFGVTAEAVVARVPAAVLLVDDVVTTGATAVACARALREAGTRPVGVVSFARALQSVEGP